MFSDLKLRVDLSKLCCDGGISGQFTESGLCGMLEGADVNIVDIV